MSFIRRAIALSAVVLLSTQAHAQRPHVARPLPGYTCKMLNITVEQAMDPTFHMPYYSQPSASSPVAGYASAQVAVKTPLNNVNGFDEAIFPNGGKVWIEASVLKDYHSLGDPTAKCVPVVMSNGRQGFDYPH
jgi:hypothetical protein